MQAVPSLFRGNLGAEAAPRFGGQAGAKVVTPVRAHGLAIEAQLNWVGTELVSAPAAPALCPRLRMSLALYGVSARTVTNRHHSQFLR